ncbi:hypothetical protein RZE82_01285 [Mollicutes bacterium LVI A0039]|nr:hypothetical protein RZE82_01285 [Mollicutes bacterium LVI A0039]
MDIKIKKEQESNRNLDLPSFKDSKELNNQLEQSIPSDLLSDEANNSEKHEDDLELTTQYITTEFNTGEFENINVNTLDLANDLKNIAVDTNINHELVREQSTFEQSKPIEPKPQPQPQVVEPVVIEQEIDAQSIKVYRHTNRKYIYIAIVVVMLIIACIVGYLFITAN